MMLSESLNFSSIVDSNSELLSNLNFFRDPSSTA